MEIKGQNKACEKCGVVSWRCTRCNKSWVQYRKRSGDKPVRCPKCQSPYWNKPKKVTKK